MGLRTPESAGFEQRSGLSHPSEKPKTKKRRFVWTLLIGGFLAGVILLAAVIVPYWLTLRREAAVACQEVNIHTVNAAKDQWAIINNKPTGTAVTWDDIKEYTGDGINRQADFNVGTNIIFLNNVGISASYNRPVDTSVEKKAQQSARASYSMDDELRLRTTQRRDMALFLSGQKTTKKKYYTIQPEDSLDKIARDNKTTVELIRHMNGIEGNLIYAGQKLLVPAVPFDVHVDKSDRQLELRMGEKLFKSYLVGVGRYGKTPIGTFYTVVHQKNPDWQTPDGAIIPFGDPRNILGTRWMSLEDKDRPDLKGFGIHGTKQRSSIGAESSNGTICMLNEDIEELFMFLPRDSKITIAE
jgi:lipoprotein-anchoring transpeptidase ErfK/SrfK